MNGSDTDPAPVTEADKGNDAKTPSNARLKGFAAGTVSGASKLIVGHPFEYVHVLESLRKN